MKNLVLKPNEAEHIYRLITGDVHMVNRGDYNETVCRVIDYVEKWLEEKYADEEDGE